MRARKIRIVVFLTIVLHLIAISVPANAHEMYKDPYTGQDIHLKWGVYSNGKA